MTNQIAAVERPDSASHYYCEIRVNRNNGTYGDNLTHHIIRGTCRYCGLTDTQIRKAAGL